MTEVAGHPSLDEIAAYHAGSLPPAEEAILQNHLVACGRCTALLLERDELAREIEASLEVSDIAAPGEDAEAWEALRARLPQGEASPRRPAAPTVAPLRAAALSPRPGRRTPPWLPAIAASLLVATLGLTAWNVSLNRRLKEMSRPEVNAPIHELIPGPLRGPGEASILELGHGARFYTLVLRPSSPPPPGNWQVEIARADGTVEWRGEGLQPNELGSFSLTLNRSLVSEGEHVIRLRGPGPDGQALQDEYRLRIVARG